MPVGARLKSLVDKLRHACRAMARCSSFNYLVTLTALSMPVSADSTASGSESIRRDQISSDVEIREQYVVHKNIVYTYGATESGKKPLYLDLYLPSGSSNESKGTILYVHGGTWKAGSKDENIRQIRMLEWFVERHYAVVAMNYRLQKDLPVIASHSMSFLELLTSDRIRDERIGENARYILASIEDIDALFLWLTKNADQYGIDDKRVVLAGGSAGAISVLLRTYMQEERVCDGDQLIRPQAIISLWGAMFGLEADLVDTDWPPTIMVHGLADDVIPASESIQVQRFLEESSTDVELILFEGLAHGLDRSVLLRDTVTSNGTLLLDRIDSWLQAVLRIQDQDMCNQSY